MFKHRLRILAMLIVGLFVLVACEEDSGVVSAPSAPVATPTPDIPDDAVEISIIYAPESDLYLPQAVQDFNQAYREGRNPLTGEALGANETPIFVDARPGSSGTVMQGIVTAVIDPNNASAETPTIFAPSVSHWLALANYQSGREIFDLANSPATANAPVVMAIWESRLNALQEAYPDEQIGWKHLLEVLNNPDGWQAYGVETDRKTVYYGHTDPYVSSTALSTLISEYVASAEALDIQERRLSLETVRNEEVQDGVRNIEHLIRHYSRRTTEFKEYIAQGPDYLDFVALEENDLIFINQGKTEFNPPEPLVALYPAEGTFWHEHPFAIVSTELWVTEEQKAAAEVFTEYVLSPVVQEQVLANGFRPVNPDVEIGHPIVPELGVDPEQPYTVLQVPDPQVISAVQESWSFVKKAADIWLVIDVSGSMGEDNKLEQAKDAAIAFVDSTDPRNRVGLIKFSDTATIVTPLGLVESNSQTLKTEIQRLQPEGATALFDSIIAGIDLMHESDDDETENADNRIRSLVVLSDGADTAESTNLQDVLAAIEAEREQRNPVVIIPIAYGNNADITTLNRIAQASSTKVQTGNPDEIMTLLELISSYF